MGPKWDLNYGVKEVREKKWLVFPAERTWAEVLGGENMGSREAERRPRGWGKAARAAQKS